MQATLLSPLQRVAAPACGRAAGEGPLRPVQLQAVPHRPVRCKAVAAGQTAQVGDGVGFLAYRLGCPCSQCTTIVYS